MFLWRFLYQFIDKQLKWFVVVQLLFLAWTIEQTLYPYILGMLVDRISNYTGDRAVIWEHILLPVVLGATLWITVEIANRLSGIGLARILPRFERAIRLSMYDYVQNHSYRYFITHMPGSVGNKINDMVQSASMIVTMIMTVFLPGLVAVIIVVIMFFTVQPIFAAIIAVWLVIHFGVTFYYAKTCDKLAEEHAEKRSELSGGILDSLINIINVKAFANQPYEQSIIREVQQEEELKNWRSLFYVEKIRIYLGLASLFIPGFLMTWIALLGWQREMVSLGEVVYILNANWNVMLLMWYVGFELPKFYRYTGTCRQALSIIRDEHSIKDVPNAKELLVTEGKIRFHRVNFRFRGQTNLFKNKSLTIKAKQRVGLVGFSGSGKSTFVNIIMRFYDIDSGEVIIDGQNIADVTQNSLRKQIAYIPQEPILFHRSIKENIRYGKLDATEEEIIAAAKQAYCHDFIMSFSQQYDTLVGERGAGLSGGQRQRIAIARAILKNAPILILDEATSALDTETEMLIQKSLKNLMRDRTTIVIAHRLSTLQAMNRILVFKAGQIIEDGSHRQLLKNERGHYACLWNLQMDGLLPDDDMPDGE